jgi:hypothetical protein
VLLPSDAKRSQSHSSGSALSESIVCVDGEISLPHHPNGTVPERPLRLPKRCALHNYWNSPYHQQSTLAEVG